MKTAKTKETLPQWLLGLIEKFMDLNDMEPDGASFGWHSVKDCYLVTRLRDGGDIRTANMEQILAFMQNPISANGKPTNLKPIKIKRRLIP